MSVELAGVIPANILPFDDSYSIDLVEYRRHLQDLLSTAGVRGITCNGHAGEVASLSQTEWQLALTTAVETVQSRVPVICGIYAETHREAGNLARTAASEGADALLVFPPNLLMFDASPEVAFQRFAEIAEAVDLPLIVFVYPRWTGLYYDPETLGKICDIRSVAAIKDWTLDIGDYERNVRLVRAHSRQIAVLSSFSTSLLPSLVAGADGILSGHGSVIAAQQAELFDLAAQGDMTAAGRLYERIQILTRDVYRSPLADMYTRMKEQLVMLGRLRTPIVRPPLLPLRDDERRRLRDSLLSAGLLASTAAG